MHQKLPVVIWSTMFLMWLCTFALLINLVHSKAGMGEGLVEDCLRQKTLADWSRAGQISVRGSAAMN